MLVHHMLPGPASEDTGLEKKNFRVQNKEQHLGNPLTYSFSGPIHPRFHPTQGPIPRSLDCC